MLYVNEYDSKGIASIIRRYQELRSVAEITAVKYERVSGGSSLFHGKDDIVCVLADIDQGITVLSSRQLTVVELLKRGYLVEEIGKILGLSPGTVKFHIQQAVFRLVAYLNTSGRRKNGAKRN
ncbi:luxr bacterial regulatory protein hth signature [Lucifera butyrica]|uniref:Luxr bacterial regulatory protein hth signature n=1 Tax=Lucifera butyrica TaxID=1351585 RepID=A0A498RHV6_9FIRM|nr:LuxR C-terminal-related transcriptional regulator [Lucifera butyrica]VBB09672.1 luxr bacterial regulatory protein hth signature [Lucifera butyrica]